MLRRSSFRDLLVWQKGRDLCIELYSITSTFPDEEKFGLTAQIRRAAVSVPSNIAEGHARNSTQDFARFLYISLGSVRELETMIEISGGIGFIPDTAPILDKLDELARMLTSFISKLEV